MKLTPARPGRTAILIILLLVTCYFADWSDDYLSLMIASSYTTPGFRVAQGGGGGGLSSSSMLAAMGASQSGKKDSALEAVFGSPMKSQQSQTTSATSSAFGVLGSSASDADSSVLNRFGTNRNGLSDNGFNSASSSLGMRMGTGLGLSGSSTFGGIGASGALGTSGGLGMAGGLSGWK